MSVPLHCLVVEDDAADFETLARHLSKNSAEAHCQRAGSLAEFDAAVRLGGWDVVLSGGQVPQLDIRTLLEMLRARSPDLALILVAGRIGEEEVAELLKLGVSDFVRKDNLARLTSAIERSRWEAAVRRARREADTALVESEDKYRNLFECSRDATMTSEVSSGRLTSVNPAALKMFGAQREQEILGLTPVDLSPERQPDGRNSAEVAREMVETAVREGSHFFEWTHQRLDGGQFFSNVLLTRLELGGKIVVLGTIRDISERKAAEEKIRMEQARFKLIFDSVPIGIAYAIVQPDGQYQRISNDAHLKICGLTRAEDQTPGIYQQITHPEDFLRQQKLSSSLGPDRVGAYAMEKRYLRPDGQFVWVVYSFKRQRRRDGNFEDLTTVVDITERKAAEQALRESERAFRTLAESMPQIVWICRPNGMNVYFNQQWLDYTGLTLEESYGAGWIIPFHPEEKQAAWAAWEHAVQTGELYVLESRLRRADGVYRWWLIRGVPLRDADGAILKWFGTCTDIDDLKQAEAALRDSRAKLEAALASMTDAVFISDPAGEFVDFNDAFATFHKFKGKAETLRKLADYPEILEVFLPNGEPVPLAMWAVPRALRGETVANAEYSLRRKDTGESWVGSYSFSPIRDKAGGIVGAVMVARDITERKRAEEAMRIAQFSMEHSGDAIFWINPDATFLRVNEAALRLVAYPREELLALTVHDLSPARPPATWAEHWQKLRQKKVVAFETHFRTRDGRLIPVEVTANHIVFESQEFNCAFVHDITKRRQLEAEFRQAQKMEAIGTLAGGIAHDFNNILSSIFGHGYLLQQDTVGIPTAQEYVGEILKAANRAKDLVQQILTFSRQREQKREVIRLENVIREATKFLRASLPANIQIELNLDPAAPPVSADPTQIYQVTINLATNALHAMEGRRGRLVVTLAGFTPDDGFLHANPELRPIRYTRLTITDTGEGMDAKTMERVFEPFFTTKPVGKGTGLGLSVVHGIVQSHEGVITVTSRPAQGTTFDLYFPAQAAPAFAPPNLAGNIPRGQGQNILFLDDEPALSRAMQRLLEDLNYRVTLCGSAGEAIRCFAENPAWFHLVITDLTMPEMDGLEVARQIHALRADVPVLLVSGHAPDLSREKLQEAGLSGMLEKPFSLPALAAVVKKLV